MSIWWPFSGALKVKFLFLRAACLSHVQWFFNDFDTCQVPRKGAWWKLLFLHRFYKQNEIVSILLFGVLGGLEGALRHTCFATCFKTPARIKILRRNITFRALVPVGRICHFLRQRDLEGAQDTFFEKCENASKIKGNASKRWVYELLKHQNIQNQPRIISKTDTLDFTQFDLLPRALNWPFMPVPTLPLKAQRESKFTRIRPP